MPLLSRYTPCGMLAMSSHPSHAEQIYHSLVSTLGGNLSVAEGTREDGWCYANAMGIARAWYTCERAGNQTHPHKIFELLTTREREYQLSPSPFDTVEQRQGVLASRMLLPQGATRGNIETGLREILGDGFVRYRTTDDSEIETNPAAITDDPINFQLASVPRKLIRLVDPVSTALGSDLTVRYTVEDQPAVIEQGASAVTTLLVGDTVVIEPEVPGVTETVTVQDVGVDEFGALTFTTVFDFPHSIGCYGTTAPFPAWESTQKTSLILITGFVDVTWDMFRQVHEFMQRVATGVSTWAIAVDEIQFRVNRTKLDTTTILVPPDP